MKPTENSIIKIVANKDYGHIISTIKLIITNNLNKSKISKINWKQVLKKIN